MAHNKGWSEEARTKAQSTRLKNKLEIERLRSLKDIKPREDIFTWDDISITI